MILSSIVVWHRIAYVYAIQWNQFERMKNFEQTAIQMICLIKWFVPVEAEVETRWKTNGQIQALFFVEN